MGLDLGPPGEPTGFAVLERAELPNREHEYFIRHLDRCSAGSTFPQIVEKVVACAATPDLKGALMIVDCTAVGRVVLMSLRRAQPAPAVIPVVIGLGHAVQRGEDGEYIVPKKDLVSSLQMVLQTRRLKIAPGLPQAAILTAELASFRLHRVPIGDNAVIEWREGKHDDLVLAVALAVWHAERYPPYRPGDISSGGSLIQWPAGGQW